MDLEVAKGTESGVGVQLQCDGEINRSCCCRERWDGE